MKKYELTTNVKTVLGRKLFQIKALISFGCIEAGELGGWIEKEANLSQSGNAWVSGNAEVYGNAMVSDNAWVYGNARVSGNAEVYGNAVVYGDAEVYGNAEVSGNARVYGNAWVSGNARVYGNAEVSGNARVYGNADHLVIGPLGSRKGYTTFYRRNDGVTMVVCGCFHDTIDAFEEQVVLTHGVNEHAKAYQAAVQFVKAVINTDPVEEVPSDE